MESQYTDDMTPDNQIMWRCAVCGRRLGDYVPPVGEAEVICHYCKTMNTLTIMLPEANVTATALAVYNVIWVVRQGIRRVGAG